MAAGLQVRLSLQRRPQLIERFNNELEKKPDSEWPNLDLLGKAQSGSFSADRIRSELYQAMHGGVTGWGTDEDRVFRALAGLTVDWMRQVPGRNVELERLIAAWDGGSDRICRSAPHLVFACGDADNPAAPSSCTIALATLELAAPSYGLGACWAGYLQLALTRFAPLQKALTLPEGKSSMGAMMLGYPKYRYKRLPLRKEPVITWK